MKNKIIIIIITIVTITNKKSRDNKNTSVYMNDDGVASITLSNCVIV